MASMRDLVTVHRIEDARYRLELRRPEPDGKPNGPLFDVLNIKFQRGTVEEADVNGWPDEAFLAMLSGRQLRAQSFAADDATRAKHEAARKFIDAALAVLNGRQP